MLRLLAFMVLITGFAGLSADPPAASPESPSAYRTYVYREIGGQKLSLHAFPPSKPNHGKRPPAAILLFHGGGWAAGSAEWTDASAGRFASLGMVAVSVDYRLSDDKTTPIEALDDARVAFRWVRQHAKELGIDSHRVAGYGVSAGGHLVAAAATIDFPKEARLHPSSKPDLLLLWSPALDVASDGWFRKLLQGRGEAADYSPLEHAGRMTPPTLIIQGDKDTLTPLRAATQFKERVLQAGGVCELQVYPGVGHLLTRNLADQEDNFDPDPAARADGLGKLESFLRKHGYLPSK